MSKMGATGLSESVCVFVVLLSHKQDNLVALEVK
eukprot:COSAG02_NODE_7772_length_2853_cov_1.894336_2_plen_34_part_00